MKHIEWKNDALYLLDQRLLPGELKIVRCESDGDVAEMIRTLAVRGAPAIGIAAAYGLVLAAQRLAAQKLSTEAWRAAMAESDALLAATRPTAVNLFWALAEMKKLWQSCPPWEAVTLLLAKAREIEADDIARCRRIAANGAALLPDRCRILTHCNAGALATGGYGTALGIVRRLHEQGRLAMVYADETRPLLQGARLTAWELQQENIPVTLICDDMAAQLMAKGQVDAVLVGADRVARNGDFANKIGTYGLAVLAHYHQIPFYAVAPRSTFDPAAATGADIPVEQRDGDEVRFLQGVAIAPADIPVLNPSFDVTPHELVTAMITDDE